MHPTICPTQRTCTPPPTASERAMLRNRLGVSLVQRFGKRVSYRSHEVLDVLSSLPFPGTWSCWGLATYTNRSEFEAHDACTGETCDWTAMPGLMTEAATGLGESAWSVTDLIPDLSQLGEMLPDVSGVGDLLP